MITSTRGPAPTPPTTKRFLQVQRQGTGQFTRVPFFRRPKPGRRRRGSQEQGIHMVTNLSQESDSHLTTSSLPPRRLAFRSSVKKAGQYAVPKEPAILGDRYVDVAGRT